MILNIKSSDFNKIKDKFKSYGIDYEIISESDYLNPYDYLTDEIMSERNISIDDRSVLFSRIVDATDEIGFELGGEL